MERITMNTTSLQENFSEVYKNFFAKSDLVVSGAYVFPWGPIGGKHISHYIRVKSKIPLKCYVGLTKNKTGKITFNSADFYDVVKKQFLNYDFASIIKEEAKVLEVLEGFLNANDVTDGCEISVLSETSRGHSFGFSGTMFSILSAGLFEYFGLIDSNLWDKYEDFTKSEDKIDIYHLALSLELKARYGNTIGQNIMSTLDNYSEPTILVAEQFNTTIKTEDVCSIYSKHIPLMSGVEHSVTQDIPFDYTMIFSGVPGDTKQVEQFKKADNNTLDNYENTFRDLLQLEGLEEKNIYLKEFIKNSDGMYNHVADTIGILNLKTVDLFQKIAMNGYREDLMEDFIYHINQYRYSIALLERQSSFADDFIYFFRKNRSHSNESLGIMPTASGKLGGGYVIVTKPGISIETIEKTMNDLRALYPSIANEYCSYLDGESSDGIQIEQSISKGVFSKYIDKSQFVYKDSVGGNYIGDYGDIFEREQNGLILDTIQNKIYLNGIKLTSKDIHSQNATIEILQKLMDNIGIEVSNKELSLSSYSKNKNDMVGKIILPFMKYIEKQTGEKLAIVCKGSITEFFLKMEQINLKIGTISRIK